jgi:hypothetical protein
MGLQCVELPSLGGHRGRPRLAGRAVLPTGYPMLSKSRTMICSNCATRMGMVADRARMGLYVWVELRGSLHFYGRHPQAQHDTAHCPPSRRPLSQHKLNSGPPNDRIHQNQKTSAKSPRCNARTSHVLRLNVVQPSLSPSLQGDAPCRPAVHRPQTDWFVGLWVQ